ncbi:LuxR C-terminal-related transcriptional regulator [Rhodococcus sp. ABRD24]|uniref:ATP-binding protein n=1 Tax=Rhodococcus sp. ABRD24 TaxID=2507582 RepID=UPI001F6217A8|nr:LuxR C-terminal-related transcriptional regulator [Rhodococcus sp. ABRD24]
MELTSFVGRRAEVAEARRLLTTAHLLTLTGIGGVGKTRLALRVAKASERAFPDGVWFVELDELHDPALLAETVAGVFGLRDQSSRPARELLVEYLVERRALIVLDNCEHLVDAVAVLTESLLRRCPDLRILATSREALGIGGEVVLRVPPMVAPDPGRPRSKPGIPESEAVTLFAERAASVLPGFDITEHNRPAVAWICHRLDGLPLPIELAAARMRAMSADQIRNRLSDRYRLLTDGSRVAPTRQQTLRLCVDWSHELCTPDERVAWARLSVFSGGFDLEAAEFVCGRELPPEDLLDVVASLVDKSILLSEKANHGVRYRMLETLRQYGQEQLAATGELSNARRRHRDWFEGLVLQADREWIGARQAHWMRTLFAEQSNIRSALEYCLHEPGEAGAAVRIAAALHEYWLCRGMLGEGRHWIARAVSGSDDRPGADRVRALCAAGQFAGMQSDLAEGAALVAHARRLADELGDADSLALVTHGAGRMAMVSGDLDGAVGSLTDALASFRAAGDTHLTVLALQGLGIVRGMCGDVEQAVACHEEVMSITAALGESEYRARAMWLLGLQMWTRGDAERASALAVDSLRLSRMVDDHFAAEGCIELLAWTCADGRSERAAVLSGAAESLSRAMGTPPAAIPTTVVHHEECRRQIRRVLGEREFDAAFARGGAMSFEDAVDYALEEKTPPATPAEPRTADAHTLTRRERQVAELVARGLTNKEIASELVIAQRTAEGHVEHILSKLGFTSRAQIATWVAGQAAE